MDSPARRRLPPLLRRAWYGLNQAFRRRAAQAGITPDQFTVLRILHEQEPARLSQRNLAEKMSSDPNTIASLLQRMAARGWVGRCVHAEDRRVHHLALTLAGRRKFREAKRLAAALQRRVLSSLPEGEREGFLSQLERVAVACWQVARHGPWAVAATPHGRQRRRNTSSPLTAVACNR